MESRLLMSTYTVNTVSDAVNPGPGLLTLRQALADADTRPGADTIAFDPKVFTPGSMHTIALSQGQIDFTDNSGSTTVNGPGESALVINGGGHSRVFKISTGVSASISGLTVTGGSFIAPVGTLATGGGVLNNGKLVLTNVSVTNSKAQGAADPTLEENGIGDAEGGGVYSNGTLSIVDSVISGNTATGGSIQTYNNGSFDGYAEGGGIYSSGSLNVSGSVISNNGVTGTGAAGNAEGGGIYCSGTLLVGGTTLTGNQASVGPNDGSILGGAIYAAGPATIDASSFTHNSAAGYPSINFETDSNGPAWGGAVFSTDGLTVSSSTFTGNQAIGAGGSNFNNDPGGNGYGGAIAATGSLTITGSMLSTNLAKGGPGQPSGGGIEAGGFGGAIYAGAALSIASSTISGNIAQAGTLGGQSYGDPGGIGEGGGVYARGISVVSASIISGNSALGGPGDFNDWGDNVSGGIGAGGGLFSSDSVTVSDSTFAGNEAVGGAGGIGYNSYAGAGGNGIGGAIYSSTGTLDVVNSTVTGNTAAGGAGGENQNNSYNAGDGGNALGGGIYAIAAITVADSTIVQNTSTGGAGGAVKYPSQNDAPGLPGTSSGGGILSGKNTLSKNSVISDNNATSGADVYSTLSTSSANNLIGYGGGLTNGVDGNKIGIHDPKLLPLGNYGGPTQTMPPMAGSPVIGGGSVAPLPSELNTDQRGFPRFSGTLLDIGAVEYGNASISGVVFNDLNANGKKDAGESGLAGVKLFIDLNVNGSPDAGEPVVTTNASGAFTFSNLPAGKYRIWEETPAGYRVDSPAAFFSDVIVANGATATGVNFADTQKTVISGTIFNDLNKNGTQDNGEPDLAGWRVYVDLTNSGSYKSSDPSVVTATNGSWSFNTLSAGTYYIRIVPQTGWKTTTPSSGYFKFTVGAGGFRVGNLFGEFK